MCAEKTLIWSTVFAMVFITLCASVLKAIPDEESMSHLALPSSDTSTPLWLHRVLPETVHRNTVFHLLLPGGKNQKTPSLRTGCLPVTYNSLAWNLNGVFVLPLSGHQGSVSVSQGSEETIMEVSHQVHDVVPEARGAQDYHWWVWTGKDSDDISSLS